MPGPASAPLERSDPKPHHGKCMDRERCTGPGCRVRTGKTRVAKGLATTNRRHDALEALAAFRRSELVGA